MAVCTADKQVVLEAMWETHREAIRRLLLSMTGNIDLADDLLQETYLCARAGMPAYRGGNPRAWLAAIARNAYRAHARQRYLSVEVPLDTDEEENGEMTPTCDSHDLLEIRQALSALTPALRTALIMKHYAGYTYQEIAFHQRCPVGTAKWRVSEALDRLRLVLLPERSRAMAENVKKHGINLVDYAYGVLPENAAAKVRAHLAACESCRLTSKVLRQVVSLLDALDGERRQMHFIELDQQGRVTLYSSTTFLNEWEQTLCSITFGSGWAPDHVYVEGEEVAFADTGIKKLADGGEVQSYEMTLPHPVQPGQRLSYLLVNHAEPGGPQAERLADGRFHFHWRQGPGSNQEFAYVQAIRLPAGAKLLVTEPQPAETREDGAMILVWRQVLSPREFFESTIEYRLGEDK